MRKRTFEIYGRKFEYMGTTLGRSYNERDLSECYTRPSLAKQSIWQEWSMWFVAKCDSISFGIASYNGFVFTISGYIILDDHYWFVEITPSHNRAWLVVEE